MRKRNKFYYLRHPILFIRHKMGIYSWYGLYRVLFRPWNRMKIRNCSRDYTEIDTRVFHSVFTLLCDYIEAYHPADGEKDYGDYVKWCIEESKTTDDNGQNWFPPHQLQNAIASWNLYQWYTSVNWKDPVEYTKRTANIKGEWQFTTEGLKNTYTKEEDDLISSIFKEEDIFNELCDQKLKEAIEIYHGWWW